MVNRRQFLSGLGGVGGLALFGQRPAQSALFRKVPPASSGIHWLHENAMSPEKYLPETLGPG
jgi:enediyne biosynthesis protein E4